MRENDRQLGWPFREYIGAVSDIEALALGAADEGCVAFGTDNDRLGWFDGSTWYWICEVSDIDHGNLAGLADDDHTIYLLTDGTRAMDSGADLDPTDASGQALGDATHRWDLYTQEIHFGGASGANKVVFPNDLADALHFVDAVSSIEYITVKTAIQRELVINETAADVDFRIESMARNSALHVEGDTGFIGIGTPPSTITAAHWVVYDTAVSTTTNYYGIYNEHEKTGGATSAADDMFGLYSLFVVNHAQAIGEVYGAYIEARLDAGTLGGSEDLWGIYGRVDLNGGTAGRDVWGVQTKITNNGTAISNDVWGIDSWFDLDTGTIGGDIVGVSSWIDIAAGHGAIGGDIFGLYTHVDADKDPTGTVYMLYLDEQTNVDYGVYQNGVADNVFGGWVGIGGPPGTGHLSVYDDTLDWLGDFAGIWSRHIKTAGASDHADDFRGILSLMSIDQAGGEVGDVDGIYSKADLADAVDVGTVAFPKDLKGIYSLAELDAGTIWGDACGIHAYVDQGAGNEVKGDIYGIYIEVDVDGTLGGSACMLYLDEKSNVDYGIYQSGTAPNVFGGHIDPSAASGQDLGDATHLWDLYTQDVVFGGATGANAITVPDNLADALHFSDAGGIEYMRIVSTDAQPAVVFNNGEADVDFRVAASGATNALFVQGSSGDIGVGSAPIAPYRFTVYEDTNTTTGILVNNPNVGVGAIAAFFLSSDVYTLQFNVYSDAYSWRAYEDSALISDAPTLRLMNKHATGDIVLYTGGDLVTDERMRITDTGQIGIDVAAPLGQLHVDNPGTVAQPVLYLDQGDVSEEMIEFATTIGVGNAIEAVGGKTLTTTHFIKVTLPGALTRYIPVGTIA